MKTFDELIQEAGNISDHRNKIFNELIEKTKNVYLPKFIDVCQSYDISMVYFKTNNKIIDYQDAKYDDYGFKEYYLAIDVSFNRVNDAEYDYVRESYFVPENYPNKMINDVVWLKTGIVEFVKYLQNRLESYNKKYSQKNTDVEKLLNI